MTSPANGAPQPLPPVVLFPQDFAVILNLLPRAQIVVGDVPKILGTLQRLEAAAKTGAAFIESRPSAPEVTDDEPAKG